MMYKKTITILVLCIAVFSLTAAACGLFTNQGSGEYKFTSLYGQSISIFGKGVYAGNSVTAVLQAKPHDIVTLAFGIPLLLISLFLARKGLIKGKLLLAGTLGYFLITYCMYTFIAMYNRLFLVYVILMSASFFALVLCLMSLNLEKLFDKFDKKLPVKFIGGYLMVSTSIIGLLWLSRVIPSLVTGSVPLEVEHGTTLPVQAFDLAFFLPAIFLSGLLLVKRKPLGYLFAPVSTINNVLIMAALFSKGLSMTLAGINGTVPMLVMTSIFGVIAIISSALIFRSLNNKEQV